jgi:hypothetical protein
VSLEDLAVGTGDTQPTGEALRGSLSPPSRRGCMTHGQKRPISQFSSKEEIVMANSERARQSREWEHPDYERERRGRGWEHPDYERERQSFGERERWGREWEHPDYERGRRGYGREQGGWDRQGSGWERTGREWERQGAGGYDWRPEREPPSSGRGPEGREWGPPPYGWRQQNYPWGQQGQEGYFGWGRQDRGWEQGEYGGYGGYEGERQGSRWGQGYHGGQQGYGREGTQWGQQDYGPYTGRGPKGYRRSDERIREDICDRLTEHPAVDASEIEVVVKDCEVTLTGTVESRAVKHLAENMAETVPGVKEVHNQLRVTQWQQSGQTRTTEQDQKRRTAT